MNCNHIYLLLNKLNFKNRRVHSPYHDGTDTVLLVARPTTSKCSRKAVQNIHESPPAQTVYLVRLLSVEVAVLQT